LQRSVLLRRFAVLALFSVTACVNPAEDDADDVHEEPVGEVSSALVGSDPVSSAVTQACSTTAVKGLATQLVDEIQCLRPNTMKKIDGTPGLALGAAVFPYLQTPAANALIAAQKARGVTMSINSGLRTLPQQYLLYRWYQTGRCGIGLAARPGTSNHESAVAVDINDNASWRTAMQGKGYRWLGANDPVHFDYTGGGTVDLRGLSVKAFQRLWNRNNPTDLIAEDGSYGPATEARLAKSPVGGFPKGASCNNPAPPPTGQTMTTEEPESMPGAIPDATEPDPAETPSSDTKSSQVEITPVSRPYDQTVGDGCSASPTGTNGATAGASTLLLVLGTIGVVRRRRRACADRAARCASRA
jgi:MYXO-CTERM domain-containing protein